jgi:colanic acid biosynthesis glycosyl transferase WcaI
MRLMIVGLNYAPELIGVAVYTTGLARYMAARGHEVEVLAGQPYYPAWKPFPGQRGGWQWTDDGGVRVLRSPHYIPANPNGARRLLHHASFATAVTMPAIMRGLRWRPDVVLSIAPSLLAAPVALAAARMARAKTWLHIQDFEIEAAFATGLLPDGGAVARCARAVDHAIMKQFDRVSSISPEMCAALITGGIAADRVIEFRNWTDVERVRPTAAVSPYRAEWGIGTPHVALYSGNIANKQGIGIVLETARLLRHRRDLTFVICGQGPNRAQLESNAAGLSNIRFHDLQPVDRLSELFGLATIHLLPQLAGAADLVLPSKLINMLASGRPVVATAAPGTGLAREVDECGLVVRPGDACAFAGSIVRLMDDPALATSLGHNALVRAQSRWSEAAVLGRVERDLCALSSRY